MDLLLAIGAIAIGLALLCAFVYGAIGFFAMASDQGFVGIAAFIACRVFLAQVMVVLSVLFGIYLFFISL